VTEGEWEGVRVSLLSGKALRRRATFVRTVFRRLDKPPRSERECEKKMSGPGASHTPLQPTHVSDEHEADVWISINGYPHGTRILVDKRLGTTVLPEGWTATPSKPGTRYVVASPDLADDAYTQLFTAAMSKGSAATNRVFVGLAEVQALWHMWQPIVTHLRDNGVCSSDASAGPTLARYDQDHAWAHCEWHWLDDVAPLPEHDEL